jgi:hypothetical protein
MTKRDLAEVLLRITGVYALFLALPHLGNVLALAAWLAKAEARQGYGPWMYAMQILPFLFLAVPALALIIWGDRFSRLIVPHDSDAPTGSSIRSVDIQAIALSVVAVILALHAVPRIGDVCGNLWKLRMADGDSYARASVVAETWQIAGVIVLQLGLAAALFLRARGLAAMWHKLRTAGIPGPDDAASESPAEPASERD